MIFVLTNVISGIGLGMGFMIGQLLYAGLKALL